MKNILVKYKFEGKIQEDETEKGILLEDNKVFVTEEYFAIYKAGPTNDPNVFIVDVDKGVNNLLNENRGLLLDILQPLIS